MRRYTNQATILWMLASATLCLPHWTTAEATAEKTAEKTAETAPPTPCAGADAYLAKQTGEARGKAAVLYLQAGCRPTPTSVTSVLRMGRWLDGSATSHATRVDLLTASIAARGPETDSLAVTLLETGRWPDGALLEIQDGARVVSALAPALTPYRSRLLLDIFEQSKNETVKLAAIQTLERAKEPWALLPAIHAVLMQPNTPLWTAGAHAIGLKHANVEAALVDVILSAPEGAILDWAANLADLRLEEGKKDPALVDALYRRGR